MSFLFLPEECGDFGGARGDSWLLSGNVDDDSLAQLGGTTSRGFCLHSGVDRLELLSSLGAFLSDSREKRALPSTGQWPPLLTRCTAAHEKCVRPPQTFATRSSTASIRRSDAFRFSGDPPGSGGTSQTPMYISNPDFVFAAMYQEPRFAAVRAHQRYMREGCCWVSKRWCKDAHGVTKPKPRRLS